MTKLFHITLAIILSTFFSFGQSNTGMLSMPEMNILYRGYANIVELSPPDVTDSTILIVGEGCSVRVDARSMSWPRRYFVKAGTNVDQVSLHMVSRKDQDSVVLKSWDMHVLNMPNPSIYYGTLPDGSEVNPASGSFYVKYPQEIPLHATFPIRAWTVLSKAGTYTGTGRRPSEEAISSLKSLKSGTEFAAIVEIKLPDGTNRRISGVFTVE